jgi:hypothetical protein
LIIAPILLPLNLMLPSGVILSQLRHFINGFSAEKKIFHFAPQNEKKQPQRTASRCEFGYVLKLAG